MRSVALYHALESAPFTEGFERRAQPSELQHTFVDRFRAAFLLHEQECDAALVSPIVYAADADEMSIVPTATVASRDASGLIRLVFREHLHHFTRISVPAQYELEQSLLRIVMAERYDMHPELVEYKQTPDSIPEQCDAMLLVGDDAIRSCETHVIDLVDEWCDLTELPFVHAVWAGWNSRLTGETIDGIHTALLDGMQQADALLQKEAGRLAIDVERVRTAYSSLDFTLDDELEQAISAFFQMSFYYGMRRNVPDVNRWQSSE